MVLRNGGLVVGGVPSEAGCEKSAGQEYDGTLADGHRAGGDLEVWATQYNKCNSMQSPGTVVLT